MRGTCGLTVHHVFLRYIQFKYNVKFNKFGTTSGQNISFILFIKSYISLFPEKYWPAPCIARSHELFTASNTVLYTDNHYTYLYSVFVC